MAIDPEAFYAAMPKPDAPNDRMLVQSKLVVPATAPTAAPRGPDEAEAAARRFYGQQEAQDRVQPVAGKILPPKRQRLLSGLLTMPNASMSSAVSKRLIGLSGCSAKRRWMVCATTRSS